MSENACPEIVGTIENISDYDTVFISYPIWWDDMPMIVYHFLEPVQYFFKERKKWYNGINKTGKVGKQ